MIDKIISYLRPTAEWFLNGDTLDGLVMLDGSEPPTQEEIDKALPLVQEIGWRKQMRIQRDQLLAQSDWALMPDAPTDKQAWQEYRQALRDFPATWEPGPVAEFPNPPGYVEPEITEPEVVEDSVPPVEALAEETQA